MSDREPMSSDARSRSRVARALHEDATRHVNSDLNMWPQIRARINDSQLEAAKLKGSLSVHADQEDIASSAALKNNKQDRSWRLNVTRVLPSAFIAVCMVTVLFTASLWPSNKAVPGGTVLDACDLITQAEVEQMTGTAMEQFRWEPRMEELVACAYFGKDEMVNVMVAHFSDETAAEEYLKGIRPDLISGLESPKTVSSVGGYGGRRIDISGDEGFSNSRTPSNRNLNFWDVLVRQHNRYFIVTWMTNSARPDPTNQLEDMARLVASRLPGR